MIYNALGVSFETFIIFNLQGEFSRLSPVFIIPYFSSYYKFIFEMLSKSESISKSYKINFALEIKWNNVILSTSCQTVT